MLEELNNYDWQEVFAYAGETKPSGQRGCFGSANINLAVEESNVSQSPFSREDVKTIVSMVEGENDVSDWMIVGELKDGRWFSIRAGCDYTGWD